MRLSEALQSPVALEEFLGRAKLRRQDVRLVRLTASTLAVVAERRGQFEDKDRGFPDEIQGEDWERQVEEALKKPFEENYDEISDSDAKEFVKKIQNKDTTVEAFSKLPVLGRRIRRVN